MFDKNGKYYADWRDRKGARHRKSFTSARAALLFEKEQKERANPKSTARRPTSRTSSSPNANKAGVTLSFPPRKKSSSPPPVQSSRATSPLRMSKKLTTS